MIDPEEVGMTGYSVDTWYSNPEMTVEFDFTQKLKKDTSIYGSWKYLTNKLYCYPYIDTFQALTENDTIEMDSKDKLKAYVDYVRFFNVTKKVYLDLTYLADNTSSAIMEEIEDAYESLTEPTQFQTLSTFGYNTHNLHSRIYGQCYIAVDKLYLEAARGSFANASSNAYPQQDYALRLETYPSDSERTFKIENVTKTISVSTSEQLYWALENGYRPICTSFVTNSHSAETIYTKAKNVLKQICTDEMTDMQKIQAIYEWLILNVQYDNEALHQSKLNPNASILKENDKIEVGELIRLSLKEIGRKNG